MKTNVMMLRPLNGKQVRQRTDNGFISLNDLLVVGNQYRVKDGLLPRRVDQYFGTQENREFIESVRRKLGLDKVKTAGRGRTEGTWVHPMIAIDFALWMSPSLKFEVYQWMLDQLIMKRKESGDSFKEMNIALDKRYRIGNNPVVYQNIAQRIKNRIGVDNWEEASEKELMLRKKIQDDVIFMSEVLTDKPMDELLELVMNRHIPDIPQWLMN